MVHLYNVDLPEDFQARIRLFMINEGGRLNPAFNGIRWDFRYLDDRSNLYMIWPDFFDGEGNSLSSEMPLPIDQWLNARMYIIVPEMREKVHQLKIQEGVKFHCIEGAQPFAEGVVSRIVGLYETSS